MTTKFDFGKYVPANVPGESLTPEDMARVTPEDWQEIRKLSRGYCRTVDATRSRKRMDGSATVVKAGHAPYGTDDVSDDVNQDAVLLFAQRLRDVLAKFQAAPESGTTRETQAWVYVRRDGGEMTITRTTLQRWAVRDAAARNGYRVDVPPDDIDATPGAQLMRGYPMSSTWRVRRSPSLRHSTARRSSVRRSEAGRSFPSCGRSSQRLSRRTTSGAREFWRPWPKKGKAAHTVPAVP